jgi:hypothetical protein
MHRLANFIIGTLLVGTVGLIAAAVKDPALDNGNSG